MRRTRDRLRRRRGLFGLFFLVLVLPAGMLIFLAYRFIEQDRALEGQRRRESLEAAAERAVRAIEQKVAADESKLRSGAAPPGDGAVLLTITGREAIAEPRSALAYYPVVPGLAEAPAEVFRDADDLEFRAQDFDKAIAACRRLAESGNAAIRAGALLRIARMQRKQGRRAEALHTYAAMSGISAAAAGGTPADLVARRATCALLAENGQAARAKQAAEAIAADLAAGHWRLDSTTYFHIAAQLAPWLGREPRPADEQEGNYKAAEFLLKKWRNRGAEEMAATGRDHIGQNGSGMTILWRRDGETLRALAASAEYVRREWLDPAQESVRVTLWSAGERRPAVLRSAAETGLPWPVAVSATGESPPWETTARTRILWAGLAALLVLVGAGGYVVWRSVRRELAVARLQTEFVDAVSHEFRTPLTSLKQFNEILEDDETLEAAKRRQYHRAQTRATQRLERLIESLLDFGRMEAGRQPYRMRAVDAAALVSNVASEFKGEVESQGFEIRCGNGAGPMMVEADHESLARAVWNLLDNAAKYSGASRAIEVSTEMENGEVTIAVRDHGIGIPAAEQKQIFQKFVRGAAAREQSIKGTGLGLAMVQHIVGAHGGRVTVESEPGRGSTFRIVLPARG